VTQQSSADFLIIGAGAAGLSVARELCEVASVIVLEREHTPGYHATSRSAAIFVDSYGDEVIQRLTAASRPLLDTPPFAVDSELLPRRRGLLHVARTTSLALSATDSRAQLPVLTRDEARALVPILRETAIAYAHWEEGATDIDVHALLTGLQRHIKMRGGRILPAAPVMAARRAAGIWTLTAGASTVSAPIVINAAGAWASEVGRLLGARDLPLIPFRRTAATLAPPDGVDISAWPMVVDLEESVYFKPDAGVFMLSPADETPVAAHDAYADDLDVAIAVDRFENLTDCSVRRVLAKWAGLRTMAPDRRPVIGFDSEVEGLFWLAGQGGFGIQTALGAAALSRNLIGAGGTPNETFAGLAPLLSPARLSAQGVNRYVRASASC
jgi:D-arginine dehydrogenase